MLIYKGLHVSVSCPLGQYEDKDTCQPCAVGSYQDTLRSVDCKLCPSGTSTASQSTRSRTLCKGRCFVILETCLISCVHTETLFLDVQRVKQEQEAIGVKPSSCLVVMQVNICKKDVNF